MQKTSSSITFESALVTIAGHAESVDQRGRWPMENLRALRQCGAMAWSVPTDFGGDHLPPVQLQRRYQLIAAACLTTALILTQRDAAIDFLAAAAAESSAARRLLRQAAGGRRWLSIGISQVTTSTRHGSSALIARPIAGGYRLDGTIPWATSAHHADDLIAAAEVHTGDKLLFILPMDSRGVSIPRCRPMAVLNGSDTASVKLSGVRIGCDQVLAGPSAEALKIRARRRRFTLNTCVLPLGVAQGALAMAQEQLRGRSRLCRREIAELRKQWQQLVRSVYRQGIADTPSTGSAATQLRAQCNHMAMRSALAALELAKGSGLHANHPAQRRVREAMFFFVWSSPAAVIEKTLAGLAVDLPIC
jgi:butyryl-CoA dehydrogenase